MIYPVQITQAARRDLEEIYTWIAEDDSIAHADHVPDRLMQMANSIATFPGRGSRPHELLPGMKSDYRQVFFKPYRVIYQVKPTTEVVTHLIADGRRNLQSILLRMLTQG